MFSSSEKTNRTSTTVQQKSQQQTFFRKAGEESFFGGKEQPSFFNAPIQAKLSISSPDDPQEKEADAVADNVMRMPAPVSDTISTENEKKIDKKEDDELQTKSESPTFSKTQTASLHGIGHVNTSASLFRNTDNVPGHANEEDNNIATGYINRKATGLYHSDTIQRSGRGPPANSIPFEQSLSSSKGAGSPLPGKTRQFMESRFNADFGGVRIHTGLQADSMNKSIQAKAFAHGNDIYFKQGQHDPESPEGAKLLAHELTHTIQQGASPQTLKNSNTTANPAQSVNEPAGSKSALSPAAPSASNAKQPATPGHNASTQPESELPVTNDLSNQHQPAEHSAASSQAAPGEANTATGDGTDKHDAQSSSHNDDSSSKPATKAPGNEHPAKEADRTGSREQGETKGDKATVANDRINAAKDSSIKTPVVIQAALINLDYLNTVTRLNTTSSTRKQEIHNIFSAAHINLDTFFINNILALTTTIQVAQANLTAHINATLAGAQALIATMAAMAVALVTNAIGFVSALVTNAVTAITGRINTIASRITNLVNAVNLPDLPGVETVRGYINNSISSIAGLITSALSSVQAVILSVLTTSMLFLTRIILNIARSISTILANIAALLNRIISRIAAALQSILMVAMRTLLNLLYTHIHPMLTNIEAMIAGTIDTLHQKALKDAAENREQALEALAAMVDAPAETTKAKTKGKPMTMAEINAEVSAVGKQAAERNKEIADTFDEDTAVLVGMLRQRSVVIIAIIIAALLGAVAAIMIKIMELVAFIGRSIATLSARIIGAFAGFVARILTSIGTFMTSVGRFISDPLNAVNSFVENAISSITLFAANAVRRFISGLFGTNSQAATGVQAYAGRAGAFNPAYAPGNAVEAIINAIIDGFTILAIAFISGAAVIIGYLLQVLTLAIIIGLAVLLAIFLLWRRLRSPNPKPYPKPKPRPKPAMTHQTEFTAPDGSKNNRNKIGVGEQVAFTGNTKGDWTASGGTPLLLADNDAFDWTAPARSETITITFSVGGNLVSEDFEVIEPSHYTAIKKSEMQFLPGDQGVGMILDFSFHPKTISFGNVQQMEVSGPATNITGYFLLNGMPHPHNSGDSFFDMSEDNLFESARDTAAMQNFPQPWSAGGFDWIIPNHFKLKSEAGNGKKYHNATQSFRMADATGKTTVTKEGASAERSPI